MQCTSRQHRESRDLPIGAMPLEATHVLFVQSPLQPASVTNFRSAGVLCSSRTRNPARRDADAQATTVTPGMRVGLRRSPSGTFEGRHRSGAARAEAPLRQVATPRNWLRGRLSNNLQCRAKKSRLACRKESAVSPLGARIKEPVGTSTPKNKSYKINHLKKCSLRAGNPARRDADMQETMERSLSNIMLNKFFVT